MQKSKLNKSTVNAVAHNLILDTVLKSAWDFVCSLAPTNEFDYAFVNSAAEDYCDTIWHTTQNVTLHESIDLIDANDMYNTAVAHFHNFLNTNLADLTVEAVYETLNSISGDTAMRDNYYELLRLHFENFVAHNKLFELQKTKHAYYTVTKLVSNHTYADKVQLVSNYLNEHNAHDLVELNNTIA